MVVAYGGIILALGMQRQVDDCEFEASLIYRVSSRTTKATQRNPVFKNKHHQSQMGYSGVYL